jgi:hypothetical protein
MFNVLGYEWLQGLRRPATKSPPAAMQRMAKMIAPPELEPVRGNDVGTVTGWVVVVVGTVLPCSPMDPSVVVVTIVVSECTVVGVVDVDVVVPSGIVVVVVSSGIVVDVVVSGTVVEVVVSGTVVEVVVSGTVVEVVVSGTVVEVEVVDVDVEVDDVEVDVDVDVEVEVDESGTVDEVVVVP